MAFKIKPPHIQEFPLEKSDELYGDKQTGPTMVTIRQGARGENERRNQLFAIVEKEYTPNKVAFKSYLSMDDVYRKEVFLTMVSCNIQTENGEPLFKFENGRLQDELAFELAWARLPEEAADEIISKVHEVNIQWTPQGNGL